MSFSSLLQQDSQRPALTSSEAVKLAKEFYGLNVISCQELPSYDDRNFRLCCDADGVTVEYLLKAHNSKDSANTDFIRVKCPLRLSIPHPGRLRGVFFSSQLACLHLSAHLQ